MEQPHGWTAPTTAELVARALALADALDADAVPDGELGAYVGSVVSDLRAHAETSENVQRRLASLTPEQLQRMREQAAALLAAYLRRRRD